MNKIIIFLIVVCGLSLAGWLTWQLKKFEGFLDEYDYRKYKKKK